VEERQPASALTQMPSRISAMSPPGMTDFASSLRSIASMNALRTRWSVMILLSERPIASSVTYISMPLCCSVIFMARLFGRPVAAKVEAAGHQLRDLRLPVRDVQDHDMLHMRLDRAGLVVIIVVALQHHLGLVERDDLVGAGRHRRGAAVISLVLEAVEHLGVEHVEAIGDGLQIGGECLL